jgi:hypothetical protein
MFIKPEPGKAPDSAPKAGDQLASEITDEDGNVLYRAIYDLSAAPATDETPGISLRPSLVREEWPDAAFKAAQAEEAPVEAPDAKTVLDAVRLGWDIIKDNRAVTDIEGASTAILNPKNMNPFDYTGAREGQSSSYYWSGYNWPIKSWKAFEIWLRISGAYGAKAPPDIPPGEYIPSLYVDFPHSPWAGFGLTMNARASVMKPWNAGPAGHVVAQCDIVATVTVSSIVDPSRPQGFKFVANGRSGFRRK